MENTRNSKKYEYVRKTFTWDGKRYDVKGKTIEEVYKKIAKMKVSLERGEIVINANTTVDHWFKEWVETYKKAAGLTPKSLKMYDEKYRNYIQPVIGAMKLRDVRAVSYTHLTSAIKSFRLTPSPPASWLDLLC